MKKKYSQIIYGKTSSESKDTIFVKEEDFEMPHGDDYKIAISELAKIQATSFNGTTIMSLFLYRNIPIWWFIYQSLISRYKKLTNFIELFTRCLDEYEPKNVKLESDFEKLHIIKQICATKNIDFEYSKLSYLKHTLLNKFKNSLQSVRFSIITNKKIHSRKKLFIHKRKKLPSIQNKIIFAIPTVYRRKIFDSKTGQSKQGEYIQQTLIELLDTKNIIGIDLDYTFKGNLQILSERLEESISWFPLEILLKNKNLVIHNEFLKNYKNIIRDPLFQKLFNYNGISIWESLKQTFDEMSYAPHIPFYLNLIDSLESTFKKEKPRIIFLPYETGPQALAFISVAKKFEIKTIGIQHGYIYENSPLYSFGEFVNERNIDSFPIPDCTLVFGNYVKNLLIKNHYPESKIEVIGNPSFFNLKKLLESFDKKTITQKFSIDNSKQIILFATGKLQRKYVSHGKYDYDEKIWDYLLRNFGNNKNIIIILKPHPSEKDVSVYNEILKRHKSQNAFILNENLFELITISSVVISVFSSAMLDSLLFKKPVIRVTFDNEIHSIFDHTDAVISTNLTSLGENILEILNSDRKQTFLTKNAENFLQEHYGIPEKNPETILKRVINAKDV